jgi:hypothetical protein
VALFVLIGGLPSAVTDSPPAFLRASAAMPAAFIAVGAGVGLIERITRGRAFAIMAVGLVAATAGFTVRDYFGTWANHDEVQRVYRSDLAAIAEYLRTHDASGGVAISTTEPHHLDRFIFDYTPHGEGEIHWFDGLNALVVPAGGESAWVFVTREPQVREDIQAEYLSRAPLVEERYFENGSLAYALYALPPGEAFFEAFPPPMGQGVWVSDVMAFPPGEEEGIRQAVEYPVQFGDVVELVGYESPDRNPAGTWLPIRLYFRVLRDVDAPEPWALFAHVLREDGTLAAGRDFLAVPASTWRAGDVFIQLNDGAAENGGGRASRGDWVVLQADGGRFPDGGWRAGGIGCWGRWRLGA